MTNTALHILQNTFGYPAFRGEQAEIVDTLCTGGDALVLMPTGGGKSLCYQIPALVREGVGVVISPLIALMQDQVNALAQLGIAAAYLNSSLSQEEQWSVEQRLRRGQIKLLYIAPERLIQTRMLDLLHTLPIALFAIDEAHCVSQWGHDFRSDYLELSLLHEQFPEVPRIALTATADARTRNEIARRLQLAEARQFVASFDRPNIQYRIEAKQDARQQLLHFLRSEHAEDAGIIYCLSRKKVEETAHWLQQQGFNALPYHAGLSGQQRQENQMRFLRDDGLIMVATIAFGMGIDKPDVRFVAHLDLPKSIESYYQETGRAGRDGANATAWMVYGVQDVLKLRQMLTQSPGSEEHKRIERQRLDAMLGLCEITSCRRQALLAYFGEDLPKPCGNCDSCLTPVETFDGTVVAQKALSCCYRSGQKFGVNHLVDILLGKMTPKVEQFGHQKLSTFGIGTELDAGQWRSVYRQLAARAYLQVDMEGFGGIMLTEKCRALLKGEETIELRREDKTSSSKSKEKSGSRSGIGNLNGPEKALWERLRELRKKFAQDQGVPPYVIFHDATLLELVRHQPETEHAMGAISGIGQGKLDRYGKPFLAVITAHKESMRHYEDNSSTEISVKASEHETFTLLRAGHSVAEVAQQRELAESTIFGHAAALIEQGQLRLEEVVTLAQEELDLITDVMLAHSDEPIKLRPIFDELGGVYNYGLLKCVHAALQREIAG
ncbi:MAG: DNA helicase RecQ [Cellvibrionaceae bacterium]|nr:DNA helicase RecQ [Cellvibrionaceae bacterium]